MVLLTAFVHHSLILLHIIKLIQFMSNYQMEIKSLSIILDLFSLNQNHVIDNVLYIPCFTFNLLSVCVLTFESNGCHI